MAVLAIAAPARAADQLLFLGLGGARPESYVDLKQQGRQPGFGPAGTLRWIAQIEPRLGFGADLAYLSFGRAGGLAKNFNGALGQVGMLSFIGRYRLAPELPVRPYGLAGLGLNRTSQTRGSDRPLELGLNFGAGLELGSQDLIVAAEIRAFYLTADRDQIGRSDFWVFTPQLLLGLRIGGQ